MRRVDFFSPRANVIVFGSLKYFAKIIELIKFTNVVF